MSTKAETAGRPRLLSSGAHTKRLRLTTRIHSNANLKKVWRYTSTPPTFLCGVHMDYQGGDTREQVTGQLNLTSVELKGVLHCYHDKQIKHGGSG
jgi:hypothetical protein